MMAPCAETFVGPTLCQHGLPRQSYIDGDAALAALETLRARNDGLDVVTLPHRLRPRSFGKRQRVGPGWIVLRPNRGDGSFEATGETLQRLFGTDEVAFFCPIALML